MAQSDGPREGQVSVPTTEPGEPKPGYLNFLRWMAEHDRLEHRPFGPPSGRYAAPMRRRLIATWGGHYQ